MKQHAYTLGQNHIAYLLIFQGILPERTFAECFEIFRRSFLMYFIYGIIMEMSSSCPAIVHEEL
jgi:hypothetical protein